MALSLGSASLLLSVNAKDLDAGLSRAEKQVGGLAGSLPSLKFPNFASSFELPGGAALIGGGPWLAALGVVTGAFQKIGEVGHAAFDFLREGVEKALERVDKVTKQGRSLGLTFQDMSGLKFAADLAGLDDINGGMRHLVKTSQEAQIEGSDAQRMFNRIGIDPSSLKGDNINKLLQINDAINRITDSGQRQKALLDIFGKSGLQWQNVLTPSLKEDIERGKKRSGGLSDKNTGDIENAKDAFTELNAQLEGMWNRLAAGLAPAIDLAVRGIVALVEALPELDIETIATIATEAVKQIAIWGSLCIEVLVDAAKVAKNIADAPAGFAKGLFDMFTGGPKNSLGMDIFKDMDASKWGDFGAKAVDWFDKFEQKMADKKPKKNAIDTLHENMLTSLHKLEDDLDKQMALMGKGKHEGSLWDLKKLGAKDEDLEAARKKMDQVLGKEIDFERDPTLKMKERLKDLDHAWQTGGIKDPKALSFGREKALLEAEKSLGLGGEHKLTGANLEGSRAAVEAEIRHSLGKEVPLTFEDRIQRINEAQLEMARQQKDLLSRVAENTAPKPAGQGETL